MFQSWAFLLLLLQCQPLSVCCKAHEHSCVCLLFGLCCAIEFARNGICLECMPHPLVLLSSTCTWPVTISVLAVWPKESYFQVKMVYMCVCVSARCNYKACNLMLGSGSHTAGWSVWSGLVAHQICLVVCTRCMQPGSCIIELLRAVAGRTVDLQSNVPF